MPTVRRPIPVSGPNEKADTPPNSNDISKPTIVRPLAIRPRYPPPPYIPTEIKKGESGRDRPIVNRASLESNGSRQPALRLTLMKLTGPSEIVPRLSP